jgi:hypothetical protein
MYLSRHYKCYLSLLCGDIGGFMGYKPIGWGHREGDPLNRLGTMDPDAVYHSVLDNAGLSATQRETALRGLARIPRFRQYLRTHGFDGAVAYTV